MPLDRGGNHHAGSSPAPAFVVDDRIARDPVGKVRFDVSIGKAGHRNQLLQLAGATSEWERGRFTHGTPVNARWPVVVAGEVRFSAGLCGLAVHCSWATSIGRSAHLL